MYDFYRYNSFYQGELKDIYYHTDTKLKTITDPDFEGYIREQIKNRRERSRRRKQGTSHRSGGSRTKKLNKINSRNKSKKINF